MREVSNLTTNENTNVENSNTENREEELKKLITALFHRTTVALKTEFPEYEVSGHVRHHQVFGPFFAFDLKLNDKQYSCGFMFNELIEKHKDFEHAKQWLASFFIDMIDEEVSKPFPTEAKNAEEANAMIRDIVLPHCLKSITEEFGENKVHVKLSNHEKLGGILESGFVNITTGKNICGVPVNLLLALYLLNRDCADLVINGLYKIQEEANKA